MVEGELAVKLIDDAQEMQQEQDPWTLAMDPDERAAYERWVQRGQDLRKTRERRRCYQCFRGTGRVRRVVSQLVVAKDFDPTTGYRLTCGHVTIDVDVD